MGLNEGTYAWRFGASAGSLNLYNSTSSPESNLGTAVLSFSPSNLATFVSGVTVGGTLATSAGRSIANVAKTGSYVLTTSDDFVYYTGTGGHTFTLFTPTSNAGRTLTVKNRGTGTLTIASNSGSQIFGGTAASTMSLPVGQSVTFTCDGTYFNVNTPVLPADNFGITVDGSGQVPTTGELGSIVFPYSCTILRWDIFSKTTGSAVLDIKRSGTSIIGTGNKPTLSSQTYAGEDVSGWTSTSVTAGDVLVFNLDSASTLLQFNAYIKVQKI